MAEKKKKKNLLPQMHKNKHNKHFLLFHDLGKIMMSSLEQYSKSLSSISANLEKFGHI